MKIQPKGTFPETMFEIVLVTPVYRDSRRLSQFGPSLAEELAGSSRDILWVIADDGSGEEEVRQLRTLARSFGEIHPHVRVFEAGVHLGKGGVIRKAWAAHADAPWLAFVDADGSIDAKSLLMVMEKGLEAGPGHAALASRMPSPSTKVIQKPLRKITHRTFAAIARITLQLPLRDLQCGAKMVGSPAFQKVAPLLRENGFAFDAELLAALRRHGIGLMEIPIDWAEKSRGSVNPFSQAWPMLMALGRIRWRLSTGCYDPK